MDLLLFCVIEWFFKKIVDLKTISFNILTPINQGVDGKWAMRMNRKKAIV